MQLCGWIFTKFTRDGEMLVRPVVCFWHPENAGRSLVESRAEIIIILKALKPRAINRDFFSIVASEFISINSDFLRNFKIIHLPKFSFSNFSIKYKG